MSFGTRSEIGVDITNEDQCIKKRRKRRKNSEGHTVAVNGMRKVDGRRLGGVTEIASVGPQRLLVTAGVGTPRHSTSISY